MTSDRHATRVLRVLLLTASSLLLLPAAASAADPTPTASVEPTAEPTEAPASASILIVNRDTRGTDGEDDDTLLDGADFEVYADDGDGAFDPGGESLAFGPEAAPGGMLDTSDLPPGSYWIVQSTFPAGYMGAAPFLVELNLDQTQSCFWTEAGLEGCDLNDQGSEHLSWTVALVDNHPFPDPVETTAPTAEPTAAPTADATDAPTGGVEGATGTPGITLPPTDEVPGRPAAASDAGARMALALVVAVLGGALLLSAPRRIARSMRSSRSDREG